MDKKSVLRLASVFALVVVGCDVTRTPTTPGATTDAGPAVNPGADGGPPSLGTSVYDIQDRSRSTFKPAGATVVIGGAVVTAVSPPITSRYRLFIQDPRGGAYSGVYVYNYLGNAPLVGDLVTLEATITEFPTPQPGVTLNNCQTTTEMVNNKITVNGHSDTLVPAPAVLTLDQMATPADPAICPDEPEKWEGVLVEVRNVKVVSANPDSSAGQDFGEFSVEAVGGATGGPRLRINDTLRHDYRDMRKLDDVFQSIKGVVQYEFGYYKLEPRGNQDLTFADGTHPEPVTAGEVTIAQIQDRSRADKVAVNSLVKLSNVYVTAVRPAGTSGSQTFWVQDATRPGPFSGIEVFKPSSVAVSMPAVGSWVTIEGKYQEFPSDAAQGVSEVVLQSATAVVAGTPAGSAPAPVEVTVETLTDAASDLSDLYEGVLIKLRNATVQFTQSSGFRVTDPTGASILIWNGIFPYTATPGQTFDGITGVVAVFSGTFQVAPRNAADYTGAPELCTDGADNDIDGMVDCADPDCSAGVECAIYEGPIRRIQNRALADKIAQFTPVRVRGTVTAMIKGTAPKVWIQDAASEWSGISVFALPSSDARSEITQDRIAVGDEIEVAGVYKEFRTTSAGLFSDVTQIDGREITKLGAGATGAAVQVPVSALSTAASAEAYEGLLVKVGPVTVANAALGFNEYMLRGDDGSSVRADDLFSPRITYHFESTDQTVLFAPKLGQGFLSIIGVLEDSFGFHKIEPRNLADFVGTVENCRDAIENDLDGYYDCLDSQCTTDAACGVTTTSIGALQSDTPPIEDGYTVRLLDVYITARDSRSTSAGYFWVSSAPSAAAGEGIAVFVEGNSAAISKRAGLQVGQRVTVTGLYQQSYLENSARPFGVTRLLVNTDQPGHAIDASSDAAVTVVPRLVTDLATLLDRASAEAYEGVLIELQDVIALTGSTSTKLVSDSSTDGPPLWTRLHAHSPTPQPGQRWSTVVGVLHDWGDHYEIAPRGAADFTGNPEVCGNNLNDDLDATTDCLDSECATAQVCTTVLARTPAELTSAGTTLGQRVRVENLVVTAQDARGTNKAFWAQSADGASLDAGVFVFVAGSSPVLQPAIGQLLTVQGFYAEFFTTYGQPSVTEVIVAPPDGATEGLGTAALPAPQLVTVETLTTPAQAERYESMLVELRCVQVTQVQTGTSFPFFWVQPMGQTAAVPAKIGSKAFKGGTWLNVVPAVDAFMGKIVGVLHQDRGELELSPRYNLGDMSTDVSGCP